MKKKILEFLKDESGQTSTEYILLLVIVAIIVMKMKDTLIPKLTGLLDTSFNGIEASLQQGLNGGTN
ncbi:MAG: Flp family type IVb pilin [Bacteriovoracaceae bacterium]|nr:Flp family type IVb pilin [Bacteriovoracaceae bacterium]